MLKEEPLKIKRIISILFERESKIDVSFLNSYVPNGKKIPRYFHKRSLHNTIDIRNWKEYHITDAEFGDTKIFVTIEAINSKEVGKYIQTLLKGKKDLYIGFYNDEYLMTIDTDEMIIIAKSSNLLIPIMELVKEIKI